jgi:TPR repeat protein
LLQRANAGEVKAMKTLGYAYLNGYNGAPVDLAVARQWFDKAAGSGDPQIQSDYASFLYAERDEDRVFPDDIPAALHWYRLAADQGHAFARVQLAKMLAKGLGGPANAQATADLYRRAAYEADPLDPNTYTALRHLGVSEAAYQAWARAAKGKSKPERVAMVEKLLARK